MAMLGRLARGAVLVTVAFCVPASPAAAGTALPITVDGDFRDWRGVEPAMSDPRGDGRTTGIDLGRLYLANDGEALFLRLEVGGEILLQSPTSHPIGNRLRLYLDLDDDAATGAAVEGLGVELEIRFGEREVVTYGPEGGGQQPSVGSAGVMALPTHSSEEFEIRVAFSAVPPPLAEVLAAGGDLALVVVDEASGGDRLPDTGRAAYAISTERVREPKAIVPGVKKKRDVRLLSFNVARATITSRQDLYRRILQALMPDVIAFQEIFGWDAERTRRFVAESLPLPEGMEWSAERNADVVTVSSYPILAAAAVDDNLVVHIDLPQSRTRRDLVLFNAHTPCCGNETARDREHDNLMAVWRDLLAGRGPFAIDSRDAVAITGDLNLVGFRRQMEVLRDGAFIDPANGPDFSPGRNKGSLDAPAPRHTHRRFVHTWRNPASEFGPGRLDWLFFSKDAAKLKKAFVLDTATLPEETLEAHGLERRDSAQASDHLPLVADFRFRK
jgi:hypothetical protein